MNKSFKIANHNAVYIFLYEVYPRDSDGNIPRLQHIYLIKYFLTRVFRDSLFLLIIFFTLLLPTSCTSMIDTVSDYHFKIKFEKEIKKDNRFEELLYFERTAASDFVYDIGIKFKDGRKIIFRTNNSIYNINTIIEIENYRIYVSDLYFHGYFLEWSISYSEGISYNWIVRMINKSNQSDQFDNRLNEIIYHYDELKKLIEKIYNEDPIPGLISWPISNEDPIPRLVSGLISKEKNIDPNELGSKWGDDEELKKYTGYYDYNEHHRFNPGGHILKWKVYVRDAGVPVTLMNKTIPTVKAGIFLSRPEEILGI